MGKLSGIRVVDLTQFLPGPVLSLMMADQGAEVIKIEPPGGDPARAQAPFQAGHSVWFRNLNRGKRSVALDLKTDAGKAALWDLIATADVFLEGFRPGVIARLGFGYDAVAAKNPRIVYASLTAFGQDGPLAHHPAHDMAVQAHAGTLAANDRGDGLPAVPGVPASDMAAGLTGLAAVLMALIGREKTGRGDYCDIAMFDSLLPWTMHIAGKVFTDGVAPTSNDQRSLGGAAFYQVYACADGLPVVLGGRELKFVENLLTALGRPDLIPLGSAEPGAPQAPLTAFLRETFATRPRAEWVAWFADKDVAFAPVMDFAEAFAQEQVAARGLFAEQGGAHQLAPAIRFAGEPRWTPKEPPPLA